EDEGAIRAHLREWSERHAEYPSIAASLFRTSMLAEMGGQLFLRTIEVPEATGRALADPESVAEFFRLPFREAVEAFLSREIVSPEAFAAMSDAARQRAFTAARLASEGMVERAYELLRQALEDGRTLRQFQSELSPDVLGVTAANDQYTEL